MHTDTGARENSGRSGSPPGCVVKCPATGDRVGSVPIVTAAEAEAVASRLRVVGQFDPSAHAPWTRTTVGASGLSKLGCATQNISHAAIRWSMFSWVMIRIRLKHLRHSVFENERRQGLRTRRLRRHG
jgi:hypothetical protein